MSTALFSGPDTAFPRGCWGSRRILWFEALHSCFPDPGCAGAVGQGGREPPQGLEDERQGEAHLCCILLLPGCCSHTCPLPRGRNERCLHGAPKRRPPSKSYPVHLWSRLYLSIPISCLQAISGIVLSAGLNAKPELGLCKPGAQAANLKEVLTSGRAKAGLAADREAPHVLHAGHSLASPSSWPEQEILLPKAPTNAIHPRSKFRA